MKATQGVTVHVTLQMLMSLYMHISLVDIMQGACHAIHDQLHAASGCTGLMQC